MRKKTKHILTTESLVDNARYVGREFISIKHFPNPGDQIAVMPACKRIFELTGVPVKFLQAVGVRGQYYPGSVHPTVDSSGVNVTVNDYMFEMMKPLMESQPYIHSYERYTGQHYDLDFDTIRSKTFVNLPNGMIQSWIFYAFPDLACDLSKPWITLKGKAPKHILQQVQGKIILNFTERYRNNTVDYYFLKKYAPELIFAGTEKEHWDFCNRWELTTVPRLEIKDFLEYAYAIKNCRFILANQSLCWNAAQALHAPRLLEVCSFAANCAPFIGEHSYGFFHQVPLEHYFRFMDNTLP